uniref:DUF218 domain-containing protein n=1 Tax=Chlamydomonas leiostraca TaxID=1034604 RepID=A0A7S0S546_9CHLO|mmetsp:Transcript_7504/g.18600  ORF Transcript_7504/g.18600 Transcript_7504/m.18600 type:complete len:347 (+) Transcript_7504:365-1405(+)|eukprot:CAMPEP_0202859494 /NCGR_PEP_ID=MMETSP1391-20130828/1578_1 /ASSEMBLY_ACC=CAM_ASM_000867 /TAXON_ID=1034604 /ORGANISM="Chlamydomonas leiostraca, Strain SAG 11-49" /LENGTH=346 /DNA_ID=CAMNT_0049538527 /DNA_START=365 /DNA_END=1405 /DNA_ORIENTATION=-
MLPAYNDMHHRHGGSAWPLRMSPGHMATAMGMTTRQRKSLLKNVLQGVLLLCVLLPLWLLFSANHSEGVSQTSGAAVLAGATGLFSGAGKRGRKMMDQLPPPAAHLKNLILVAGHAVFVGTDYHAAQYESSWFLEEYQKVPGEAQSFVDHIALGVKEASRDPTAMLLFSGGQTRRAAGPRSEGLSYWVVAEAASWFNASNADSVRNRTFTEEHARDSFENLLFSLCRFYELTGHYPEHITVVSYTLKRDRFTSLHRAALRWPVANFDFVGTPVPPAAQGAQEGEARTVAAFKQDPYGCSGDLLNKKLGRDPFAVGPIHPSRCPEMKGLLQHCSPYMFEGRLPWAKE